MVDSVRAARVFATLGDWSGVRRALDANGAAADRVRSLLDDGAGHHHTTSGLDEV